ncbi:mitochondrial import protein Pam16 [Ceratobasidium sp. AG-Ba]|nr:mitochondrial import protein Pam16 [Ceratobasidium sp. AG-Ba]
MTVDEAQLILNVKSDATPEEVLKRYELLFKLNSPPAPPPEKAGTAASKKTPVPAWSHYLQSKVVRARERLEAEMKVSAEDGNKAEAGTKAEDKSPSA